MDAMVRGILDMQPVRAGLVLTLDLAVEPFQATRTPLETALRNLLATRSSTTTAPHGVVQVQARHIDNWCEISITDDGPGVPAGAGAHLQAVPDRHRGRARGLGHRPGPDQARGRGAWRQHHRAVAGGRRPRRLLSPALAALSPEDQR
jgi:hypothetical protein